MESDDLIPYILLTDEELQRAFEFTSKLEKPPYLSTLSLADIKTNARLQRSKC